MTYRVFSHGRRSRQKKLNLENNRKVGPNIEGLSKCQFAEIVPHESVDVLCARCRSQEASDQLNLEVLRNVLDSRHSYHRQAILNFSLHRLVLTKI